MHLVDGVVFPGVLDDRETDVVARFGDVDVLVVDLHRFDGLLEIRGVALDMDLVARTEFAVGDKHTRHMQVRVVVRHGADLCLCHVPLLAEAAVIQPQPQVGASEIRASMLGIT